MEEPIKILLDEIDRLPEVRLYGRVASVLGMMIEVAGLERELSVGDRCVVRARGDHSVMCEVVGFRQGRTLLLPFGAVEGIGLGCRAEMMRAEAAIWPSEAWLGRVVNALGEPIDGKGPLPSGTVPCPLRRPPPPAHRRNRVGPKIDLGVRALNTFLTCCRGQRMGIFAGSGVGKSVLLSMLARYTASDVNVIGLIGERGREVQEWLEDDLGPEGLARSVVVVATSDEPPLMRRQAAYMTLAIAEYFRDQSRDVLCLVDSVTRFAMAQREIGLSAGEPPASKGYTPSVFAQLPQLLERAGPGINGGSITGLFTVLVEGDDHNEPIADAVRGILDGQVVLDRAIAERNRYPAINILRSVSRTMPGCNSEAENELVGRARTLLATYENMAELIRIGAYKRGSDPAIDEAILYQPQLEAFLAQAKGERSDLATGYAELARILNMPWPPQGAGAQTVTNGSDRS
ncbi:MAG: flagellar protein export ATPase FliI [Alphaproteobacteria bacterium]|nr:MAG: flagellar protein export ATPase FliI [Alphaproteobacteria bacterium]